VPMENYETMLSVTKISTINIETRNSNPNHYIKVLKKQQPMRLAWPLLLLLLLLLTLLKLLILQHLLHFSGCAKILFIIPKALLFRT
jgi:hypothetical protein